jgi:lysozyme family protein
VAAENYPPCLAFTWRPENDGQDLHNTPGDHGGATRLGVTIATFSAWRVAHGQPIPTPAGLAAASTGELSELYRAWFWHPPQCDALPIGVDLCVFDFGVGSGPGTSARQLQAVLGVTQDGAIGPRTLEAVAAMSPTDLVTKLCKRHGLFYLSLGQPQFERGWLRRNTDRLGLALSMIADGNTTGASA